MRASSIVIADKGNSTVYPLNLDSSGNQRVSIAGGFNSNGHASTASGAPVTLANSHVSISADAILVDSASAGQ